MKNKKSLVIGFIILLFMGCMNFYHALDNYGFLGGTLCQNILAQSSSSGSSSGGSSSSSSGDNSSSGVSSTDKKGDKFDIASTTTKTREDGVITKESVIIDCVEGGIYDCKESKSYRYLKSDGSWSEWIPA